jgi:hypothetical protein
MMKLLGIISYLLKLLKISGLVGCLMTVTTRRRISDLNHSPTLNHPKLSIYGSAFLSAGGGGHVRVGALLCILASGGNFLQVNVNQPFLKTGSKQLLN